MISRRSAMVCLSRGCIVLFLLVYSLLWNENGWSLLKLNGRLPGESISTDVREYVFRQPPTIFFFNVFILIICIYSPWTWWFIQWCFRTWIDKVDEEVRFLWNLLMRCCLDRSEWKNGRTFFLRFRLKCVSFSSWLTGTLIAVCIGNTSCFCNLSEQLEQNTWKPLRRTLLVPILSRSFVVT